MKYYYHPESDCLFVVDDHENHIPIDPLCEEISVEQYFAIRVKRQEDAADLDNNPFWK